MSVQPIIFTVPERVDFVRDTYPGALLDRAILHVDTEHKGCWPSVRDGWPVALEAQTTHIMSLQDDLAFCPDFMRAVERVVEHFPDNPLSLFSAYGKSVTKTFDAGHLWYRRRDALWAQAIVWPAYLARAFLGFAPPFEALSPNWDDVRYAIFLTQANIDQYYAVPSWVQHVGADRSMLGHTDPRRVAPFWLKHNSPLAFDWRPTGKEPRYEVRGPGHYAREYMS